MEFVELTPSEKRIIADLRTLKPYESLEVVADKDGKPDVFFTTRTAKVILIGGTVKYVK